MSEFTYQIELILYTKLSSSLSDPSQQVISYGDGIIDIISRTLITDYLEYDLRRSIFSSEHTYSNYGNYIITHEIPNRNVGIVNIPGSGSIPFTLGAYLVIDPIAGMNNSIRFVSLQVISYWTWSTLIHEPGSSEADGDSTIFELVTPLGVGAQPVQNYVFPWATNYLWCNPETGRVLWDRPETLGEYVIAIRGSEYRNGQLIGQVTRDMMITVEAAAGFKGIGEAESLTPLTIQPTLAVSEITLNFAGPNNAVAEVYSATGQRILQFFLNNTNKTVDISALKAGAYTVRILPETGSTSMGRFVKK